MKQITVQIENYRKARALSGFLKSLNYIEKVTMTSVYIPASALPKERRNNAACGASVADAKRGVRHCEPYYQSVI